MPAGLSRVSRARALRPLLLVSPAALIGHGLPEGGEVRAGDARISRSGDGLLIEQGSSRAVIDWDSFGIGTGETVEFAQPDAGSWALNRDTSGRSSGLLGDLRSNGGVFVLNPHGILVGSGARLDVGSLVLTSAELEDVEGWMAGDAVRLNHSGSSPVGAGVLNQGEIRTSEGGFAALIGRRVENRGRIVASGGRVELHSVESYYLDFTGDGLLNFEVGTGHSGQVWQSGTGSIEAERVVLQARAASGVLDTVINLEGVVRAVTLGGHGGRITLSGGGNVDTFVSGELDASGEGSGAKGGSVDVFSGRIQLAGGSRVSASGDAAAGSVRIGGDFQGGRETMPEGEVNAQVLDVQPGAVIENERSATDLLDLSLSSGLEARGSVVLWADGGTRFSGSVTTGPQGFVEVSGKRQLIYAPEARVDAPSLLLDPSTIVLYSHSGYVPQTSLSSINQVSDQWSYGYRDPNATTTVWSGLNIGGNNANDSATIFTEFDFFGGGDSEANYIMSLPYQLFAGFSVTSGVGTLYPQGVRNQGFQLTLQADVISVTGVIQIEPVLLTGNIGHVAFAGEVETVASIRTLVLKANKTIEFMQNATLKAKTGDSGLRRSQALFSIQIMAGEDIILNSGALIETSRLFLLHSLTPLAGGNFSIDDVRLVSAQDARQFAVGRIELSAGRRILIDQATLNGGQIFIAAGDDSNPGILSMSAGAILANGGLDQSGYIQSFTATINNAPVVFPTETARWYIKNSINQYTTFLAFASVVPAEISISAHTVTFKDVNGTIPSVWANDYQEVQRYLGATAGNITTLFYRFAPGSLRLEADDLDLNEGAFSMSARNLYISARDELILPDPALIADAHQIALLGGTVKRGIYSPPGAAAVTRPFAYRATTFTLSSPYSGAAFRVHKDNLGGKDANDFPAASVEVLMSPAALTISGWNLGAILPHGGSISADANGRLAHTWWQSIEVAGAAGGTLAVWDRTNAFILTPMAAAGGVSQHLTMDTLNITGGVNVVSPNFYTTVTGLSLLKTVTFGGGDASMVPQADGSTHTYQPTVSLTNFTVDALFVDMSSGMLVGTAGVSLKTLGISTGGSSQVDAAGPYADGGISIIHTGDLTLLGALGEISTTPLVTLKLPGTLKPVHPTVTGAVQFPGAGPGSARAGEVSILNDGHITVAPAERTYTYTTMIGGVDTERSSAIYGGLRAGTLWLSNGGDDMHSIFFESFATLSGDHLVLLPGVSSTLSTSEGAKIVAGDLKIGTVSVLSDGMTTSTVPQQIVLGHSFNLSMMSAGGSALLLGLTQISVTGAVTLSGTGGVTLSVLSTGANNGAGFRMDGPDSKVSLSEGFRINVPNRIHIDVGVGAGSGDSIELSAGTLELSAPGVAGAGAGSGMSAIQLDTVYLAAGNMTLSAGMGGLTISRLGLSGTGAILLNDSSIAKLEIPSLSMMTLGTSVTALLSLSMNPGTPGAPGNSHGVLVTADTPIHLSFVELGAMVNELVDITARGGSVASTLGGTLSNSLFFAISGAAGGSLLLNTLRAGGVSLSLKGSGGNAAASAGWLKGSAALDWIELPDTVKELSLSWQDQGARGAMHLRSGLTASGGLTIIYAGGIFGLSTGMDSQNMPVRQGIQASAVAILAGGRLSLDGPVHANGTVTLGAGLSLADGAQAVQGVIGAHTQTTDSNGASIPNPSITLHAKVLQLSGHANFTILSATVSTLAGSMNGLTLSQKDDLPLTLSGVEVRGHPLTVSGVVVPVDAVIRATQLVQQKAGNAAVAAKFSTLTFIAQIDAGDHDISVNVLDLQNSENTLSRLILRTVTVGTTLRSGFSLRHFVKVTAKSDVELVLSNHYVANGDITLSAGGAGIVSAVGLGLATFLDVKRLAAQSRAAIFAGGTVTLRSSDIKGGLTISAGGDVGLHPNLTLSSSAGTVNMFVTAGGDVSLRALRVDGNLTVIAPSGVLTQGGIGSVAFRTATLSASSLYLNRIEGNGGHVSVSGTFDIRGLSTPGARGVGSWTFQGLSGSLRGVASNATITASMTTLLQLDLGARDRSVTVVLAGLARTLRTGLNEPRQNDVQHRGKLLSFVNLTAATVTVRPFNGTLEGGRLQKPSNELGTLDVSVRGYVNLSAVGNWLLSAPAASSLTFIGGQVTVTGDVRVGRDRHGELLLSASVIRVDSRRVLAGTATVHGDTVTIRELSTTLGNLTVTGSSELTLNGRLGAVSDLYLLGGNSLSLETNSVSAGGSATLSSGGGVTLVAPRDARFRVGGDLTIKAGRDIIRMVPNRVSGETLLGSTMTAGGEILISAATGEISLGLLSTSEGGVTVLAGGGTAILEGAEARDAVTVTAGETVDLAAGQIRTGADVTLSAGLTVQVAGSISTGSEGNVSVLAGSLVLVSGNIEAGRNATLSGDGTVQVARAGGVTVSSGNLDILAGVSRDRERLAVTGGIVTVEGDISAGGTARVFGSLVDVRDISAGVRATVRGSVVTAGGIRAGSEDISATAANALQVGVLSAGRHVKAQAGSALRIVFGVIGSGITAGEDITLSSERSSILIEGPANAGMLAGGKVLMSAAQDISRHVEGAQVLLGLGSSLDAGGGVMVSAGSRIHLGFILAGVGVTALGNSITLDGVSAHSGVTLSSGADVSAVPKGITAAGALTVTADSSTGRISLGRVSVGGAVVMSAGYAYSPTPGGAVAPESERYGIRVQELSVGGTLVTLHNPGGVVGAFTLCAPSGLVSANALTFSAGLLKAGALTLPLDRDEGSFRIGGGSIGGAVSLAGSAGALVHSGALSLEGVTLETLTLHSQEEGSVVQSYRGEDPGPRAMTVSLLHYAGGSLDLGARAAGVALNTLGTVRTTVSTGGVHIQNGQGLTLHSDGPMEGGALTVTVAGDLAFDAPGAVLNSGGAVSVEALVASGNITIGGFDRTRTVTYEYGGTLTSLVRMGAVPGRLLGRVTATRTLRAGDLTPMLADAAIGGVIHARGGNITAEAAEGFSVGTVIASGRMDLRTGRTVTHTFEAGAYVEQRGGVQVIRRTGALHVFEPLGVTHILEGRTIQVGGQPLPIVTIRELQGGASGRGGILAGTLRAAEAVLDARHWGVTVDALSLSQSLDLDAGRARLHGTISSLFGEYAQHYVTLPGADYIGPYQLNGVHVFGHRQMNLDRSDLAGWGDAQVRFEELYFGEGMRFSEYGSGVLRHAAKTGRDFVLRVEDDRALLRVHKVWVDPYLRRVLNLTSDELFLLSTGDSEHNGKLLRDLEEREEEGFSP